MMLLQSILLPFSYLMASSNVIPCFPVEQVRTNLLSHEGDESPAPQQEVSIFLYCKLQGPQSYYVTHSWLTNRLFTCIYSLTEYCMPIIINE